MKDLFEDWDDDERMRSLFAGFRPKSVNPEGWINKMNTWTSIVNAWCKKKRTVVLRVKDLTAACERKGEHPHCLEEVLQYMSREGILSLGENVSCLSSGQQGWIGWGVDLLVKRPVHWGWKTVSTFISGKTEAASYVHTHLLKEIGNSVFQRLLSKSEFDAPALSMSQSQSSCQDLCHSSSFSLVIMYLQNEGKLTTFTEQGTQYIKLHRQHEDTPAVTETDVGFVRLQKTLQKVEGELDKLRVDIQSITDQAKAAMKEGQKTKVQVLLRRRKHLEKMVEQKIKTMDQLEAMIHKLQNTSTNQEVMVALKSGLDAQKKIAAKGFNIDAVEDTMADIQDVYSEQAEIDQAMSSPAFVGESDDDSALEQELDELLESQRKNKSPVLPTGKVKPSPGFILPDVPSSRLSPPKVSQHTQHNVPVQMCEP